MYVIIHLKPESRYFLKVNSKKSGENISHQYKISANCGLNGANHGRAMTCDNFRPRPGSQNKQESRRAYGTANSSDPSAKLKVQL